MSDKTAVTVCLMTRFSVCCVQEFSKEMNLHVSQNDFNTNLPENKII